MIGEKYPGNGLVTNWMIILQRRNTSSHSAKVAIAWNEIIFEKMMKNDDDDNDHRA